MSRLRAQGSLSCLALIILCSTQSWASTPRPITVRDCVETRRVVDQEVRVSPDGSRVAYVVKAPNTVSNRNDYRLYVRDLAHTEIRDNGRLLLHADLISGIEWISAAKIIAHLGTNETNATVKHDIATIDADSGLVHTLLQDSSIQLYSPNRTGDTIAVSVPHREKRSPEAEKKQRDESARGFRVAFGSGLQGYEHLPEFDIVLGQKTKAGKFAVRKLCIHEAPGLPCSTLRNVLALRMSPDGKRLLLTYSARQIPIAWKDELFIEKAAEVGTLYETYVLGVYDIEKGEMRLGFNCSGALVNARWLPDSRHYVVVGPSPFGTREGILETDEAKSSGEPRYMSQFEHVFIVDAITGTVNKVANREGGEPGNYRFWNDFPVWRTETETVVRTGDQTFSVMISEGKKWKEQELIKLSKSIGTLSSITGNGQVIVGVAQTPMNPPELFAYDLKREDTTLLTDLNPEFREIQLGQVERLEWKNEYGSRCPGLLIRPAGFEEGKRYPMVFLAANTTDDFISDAPFLTTAFAPQNLANAGFIVVLAHYPADNKVPEGKFPGEMDFAYNWMSMVESVIDLLSARGLVDPDRVGIGGFSRTSWLTDFVLTHSRHKFVAASSADSGIYNYGTYFEYNSRESMKSAETQVGGPPYGETLRNWLAYTSPFNADKVSSAVLMEYTGPDDHGLEFFVALNRTGKAVELYRYPRGKHPLDTPLERQASLQRNVDWFRFWLQGYERSQPEDPEQYKRWRAMRMSRN